ncbi:MAG: ATP-grasp domain-containing protein [Methylococcales bacterium]
MKILILEFITGGGMVDMPLPENLVTEGQLMLDAIVTDMLELEQINLTVLRDARLPNSSLMDEDQNYDCILVTPDQGFQTIWEQTIRQVDAVLPIAPEGMGILSGLCADVETADKFLLNSSSNAVDITSSKLETCRVLQRAGIPVIQTQPLAEPPSISPPWVIKPDDGVGCDNVMVIDDRQALNDFIQASMRDDLILQPWVVGQAASLSVVFSKKNACLLTYNKQLIETKQGRVFLKGCQVGEQTRHWKLYQSFVKRIAKCFPGLKGYVGIDIIETNEGPVIVEINPRLTTSYAGIHKALGINPARIILQNIATDFITVAQNSMQPIRPVSVDLSALHDY